MKDFSMPQHLFRPDDLLGSSVDPISRDVAPLRSGTHSFDDYSGFGGRAEPSIAGLTAGLSYKDYSSSLQDSVLISQRRDVPVRISPLPPINSDVTYERPDSQRRVNGFSLPPKESNILFIDGLPTDCTRREVGHIFRPFIGFKEIKVIHKEPRRSGDKAMVLCFVEFDDSKCALTAMEALQGYKFDDKKPDSLLRIHFAHFPFRLPSEHDDQRLGMR